MESSNDFTRDARKVFDSVLLDEPLNFFAVYGKALTLYKDGKIEYCIKTLNQAIQLQSDDSGFNVKELRDQIIDLTEFKKEESSYRQLQIAGRVTANKDKSHKCSFCDKNFTRKFSLNRHLFLHTGEKPFKCSVCAKTFAQKSDKERHETIHSELLHFECVLCIKRFKTKKNLSSHLVTHSLDRPFKCSFCPKDFKIKRLLRFHEGLHKDTKPFNCDVCGKGFPAKPYITSHMRVHTDEKPFVCGFCNTKFKRNYDLKIHIRNQHSCKQPRFVSKLYLDSVISDKFIPQVQQVTFTEETY